MTATRIDQRAPASPQYSPAGNLPRSQGRLERLWARQVQEITELSLAFHDAAAADHPDGSLELADARIHRLQQILTRIASARRELTEIEAALGRLHQ